MKYLLSRCGDAVGSDTRSGWKGVTKEQPPFRDDVRFERKRRLTHVEKQSFSVAKKKVIPIYSASIEVPPY